MLWGGLLCKLLEGLVGVGCPVAAGGGDAAFSALSAGVVGAGEADEADGGVPECGHGSGGGGCGQLVAVLVEGDVADPVEAVLYSPVALDPGCYVIGRGGDHVQGADGVDGLGGAFVACVLGPGGAGAPDLEDLGGVGEVDPLRCLECFDGPAHVSAVGALGCGGGGSVLPGQGLELGQQPGLVGLDGQDPVASAVVTAPSRPGRRATRSSIMSRRAGISLVLGPTSCWATTAPVA